jgi:hypothetical protein
MRQGRLLWQATSHVTDLLPSNGVVTAAEFANLVIQAEGGGGNEEWLAAKFVERMGSASMPAKRSCTI